MLPAILFNFLLAFLIGFILEFAYRSVKSRKIIIPKFINSQMYGLTGAFLVILYFSTIPIILKLFFMFIFSTLVEFIIGYLYHRIKGEYLWNYSGRPFNFIGLVCLQFSLAWFVISLLYYYLALPLTTS